MEDQDAKTLRTLADDLEIERMDRQIMKKDYERLRDDIARLRTGNGVHLTQDEAAALAAWSREQVIPDGCSGRRRVSSA